MFSFLKTTKLPGKLHAGIWKREVTLPQFLASFTKKGRAKIPSQLKCAFVLLQRGQIPLWHVFANKWEYSILKFYPSTSPLGYKYQQLAALCSDFKINMFFKKSSTFLRDWSCTATAISPLTQPQGSFNWPQKNRGTGWIESRVLLFIFCSKLSDF